MISVVVPVYNVEKYLEECVNSLIHQSYRDLEILLINDGSTDNSYSICKKFEELDSRVKSFSKNNEGLGNTRNYGIKKAKGDYLIFVDSDDTLDETAIEKLFLKITQEEADIVYSGHNRVTLKGEFYSKSPYENKTYTDNEIIDDLFPRLIGSAPNKKDSISMSACGSLFRLKTIIDNNILFYSEREIISEDLMFNLELLLNCKKVVTVSECFYNYRLNQGTISTSYRKDRLEKTIYLYEFEEEFLKKNNLMNSCYMRLKRQFFVFLRLIIAQEKERISGKSGQEIITSIKAIVRNKKVQTIIKEYPIHLLGIKQQFFLYLVKHRMTLLLYICLKMNII